jgi:hypothetical protein
VYLNASSSGANFNSNALYAATNPTLNLRNNIFINNSIASGSGITAVYRRSLPILGTYSASSNNNLFYAGIPTASNVIFHDGTTSYPTIASFQALVTPRDNNSVTENTPFSSTIGLSPNYLHVDPLLPSLTESGAVNITGIIDDFDGQIRQGNAGYAGGGSAPDIGADEYDQNLPPCSSANAGTISPVSIVRCAGQTVAMNSAGYTYTAAGGIVHQWKVSSTPGGPYTNVIGSANSAVYSSNTLTSGVQYYVLSTTCTNNAQVSISNEATITINPVPTVSVSISSPTVCAGQTVLLGGSTDIGTNFLWNGPNSYTSALQSTTISNANTMSSGAYSLIVSVGSCTSVNSTFITVNPTPPAFSLTPLSSAVCAGASQTLTASAIISTPTLNFSSQINQNPAAGYPAPYSVYYGGQKMQFLVLGTELSAAGFIGGSPITSLEFPVISLGANWGVSIGECQNFEMKIGHTALTSLTSFQTGLSSVVSPSNFTPVVGGNVHNFSAPFVWDGTSNIILESSFSNNLIGNGGYSVIQYNSPTGFLSTIVYRADNQTAGAIAAATNPNINIGVARPNFVLNGVPVGTYSWSPAIGLSSTNTQSTVATPTGSTIYTIELANGLCTSQSTVSMNVVQMPTVSIATTSSLICVGNPATLTASGANTYTWSTGSTNTNITVSPSGSINYSLMGMNAPCPSATAIITISVSPALTITALASSPAVCSGQSATLSANGAPSYTWSTGANTSTIVVTPTVNTSYTVTGSSGPGCIAKKVVAIVSNSLPILVVTPSSQTVCAGELVSFSAAGANTYIWLPDNLSSQLFTALPPITTSYTLVGQAANNCKDSVMVTAVVDPCTSIGKTTSLNNFMRVFPNPSTGFITAQFEFEGEKEIHVINSLGATIIQLISDKDLETFDLSAFTKGIYFVRVSTKDGSANYKIIIE